MLPLGDNIPTTRPPIVVGVLIGLCIVLFLVQLLAEDGGQQLIRTFGFIPRSLFGTAILPLDPGQLPVGTTLMTYTLLHAGWPHLIGNLVFLWIFADNVEDALGHGGFVVFFFATSAAAALAHGWPMPNSLVPIIGASGGVSGVLGAFLMLYPHAEIRIAVPVPFTIRIVFLRAWVVLVAWFMLNFVLDQYFGRAAPIAFRAHVGGFIAGMLLVCFFAPTLRQRMRSLIG